MDKEEIRKIKENLGFNPDAPLPFEDMKYIPSPMLSMKTDKELYFVPQIEDIRVGYECEWWRDLTIEGDFIPVILTRKQVGMYNTNMEDKIPSLRVPYLTKEQIEKEGWEASQHFDKVYMKYDSQWCYGLWLLADNQIYVGTSKPNGDEQGETHPLFQGECKDINTFRYICKLLGI